MGENLPKLDELMKQPAVFMFLLFLAVAVLSYAVFGLFVRRYDNPLRQRLRGPERDDLATHTDKKQRGALPPIVERLSKAAARPLMPTQREDVSRLRRRLGFAGFYGTGAMHIFAGFRILLMLGGAGAGLLIGLWAESLFIGLWLACTIALLGLVLPNIWLGYRIRTRQRLLQESLPDALDLMVVCVEAGLTIDAAIQRVGQEIALAHPEISRELAMTHLETRIGVQRADALRNLGHRTGSASLQSLAAMLVQAERFGTSIGTALRVHADSLRVKRQHEAEERAAKTTVKLAFPVVLFIFPTVIAVLGGPAFILFFKSPLFDN
jgi:tight adherence protein C